MKKMLLVLAIALVLCGCSAENHGTVQQTTGQAETSTESMAPEETETSAPEGEVYTASGKGAVGKITVTIVVNNGTLTDCIIDGSKETPEKGGLVAQQFQEAILKGASVDDLDAVEGATMSSATIKQLLRKCMDEAGIAH